MQTPFLSGVIALAVCFAQLTAIGSAAETKSAQPQPIPISELRRTAPVNFETEVLPLLRKNCLACHKSPDPESSLVLETPDTIRKGGEHGPAVAPGKSADSRLLQLAAHEHEPFMPPADNKVAAVALTSEQLGLLKAWIDQGAQGSVGTIQRVVTRGPLPALAHPILALAITPDDECVAYSRGTALEIFDLRGPRWAAQLVDPTLAAGGLPRAAHDDLTRSLAFSRQGDLLASGGFRTVKLWRRPRGTLERETAVTPGARSLAVSPDGLLLAIGTQSGAIELHDTAGKAPVKELGKHEAAVTGLAFAPDGLRLYSAGLDKTLRAWDVTTGASVGQQTTPAEVRALCLLAGGNQLATGEADGVVRIWNTAGIVRQPSAAAPKPLARELKGHAKPIAALAILPGPKGERLLSGSEDGRLRIWNVATGDSIRELDHGGPIVAVAGSADGRRCASAGAGGVARLWNPDDGAMVAELQDNPRTTRAIARAEGAVNYAKACIEYRKEELREAEEKSKREATALAEAKKAKTADEKAVADKTAAAAKATAAQMAAQAKLAETAAALKAATDKKTATDTSVEQSKQALQRAQQALEQAKQAADRASEQAQQPQRELQEAQNTLQGRISFIATATLIAERAKAAIPLAQQAIATAETTAAQREAEKAKLIESAKTGRKPLQAVAFSRDNRLLAIAGQGPGLRLYDAARGLAAEVLAVGNGLSAVPSPETLAIAFAGDGRLYSASDQTVQVWKMAGDWQLVRTIGSVDDPSQLVDRVLALDFSPDGKLLATGGGLAARSGQLQIWNVADGQLVREIPSAHRDTIFGVRFSPDGKYLATAAADRLMKVFLVADGSLAHSFEGHTSHVLGVAWSADGRVLATCGADHVVKLWDFATGAALRTLRGDSYQLGEYKSEVTSISFIGDTEHLLVSSGDHTVRIHRTSSERDVRAFREGASFMHAAVATSDGRLIIAGGHDGILHIWNGETGYPVPPFEQPGAPAANSAK